MSASARRVCPIQRIRRSRTADDALDGADRGGGLVDQVGVDGVHQSGADLADRGAQHAEDRDRDQQPDDRVGPVPAERDAAGAEQHGEAGEAVGAGVQSVGDQGGGADLAADADAVAGDDLVADEPDDGGAGDGPEVGDRAAGGSAGRSPRSRRARRTA